MKVLLTRKFMPSDVAYLEAGLDDGIELVQPDDYAESALLPLVAEADVLLGGLLSDAVLSAAAHTRLVQIPWTGVDNVDFELLGRHDVVVCNSHSNASVVAEHAIALHVAVAKKIAYHDAHLRQGDWNRVKPDGNVVSPFSASLSGRNVVLLGYGAVNRAVHRQLAGFRPRVTIVTRSGQTVGCDDAAARVFAIDRLPDALQDADVVYVAVPLTPATRGLLDASCFAAMNPGTIVVNVARGVVIDEQALYDALKGGAIFGAGIDTWYNYPRPGDDRTLPSETVPFHELSNIVMSPHRAGYIDGGFPHLDDAITNINNVHAGRPVINRISIEHRY